MQVSRSRCDVDTACCRSVVKVAIPQRRGSELAITAMRASGGMSRPRQTRLISESGRAAGDRAGWRGGEASRTGLSLSRPRVGNSTGAFFMQFALPAVVEQAECRVATLLNLGEYDAGAYGVDRAGRDEDDVAFRDRTPLRETCNRAIPDRRAQFLGRENSFQSNGHPRIRRCREDVPCFGFSVGETDGAGKCIVWMNLDRQRLAGEQ